MYLFLSKFLKKIFFINDKKYAVFTFVNCRILKDYKQADISVRLGLPYLS